MKINELNTITDDVVEVARSTPSPESAKPPNRAVKKPPPFGTPVTPNDDQTKKWPYRARIVLHGMCPESLGKRDVSPTEDYDKGTCLDFREPTRVHT